ncbi:MAG: glycosyltransferase family 1 protein [Flavobacterium sp.]|nr:glycosyltransferase family 1 protein [Flavobacterium sp.]
MIYINSRFLTQKITGSQRFAIEISRQLKKLRVNIKFIAPKNIIHQNVAKELEIETFGKLTGHLWEQIELPVYLKKKGNPLLLSLVNTAPLFYKNKIVTILDLSWKHYPQAVSKKFYCFYNFLIPKIVRNSKHIFTVSNFSKDDIFKYFNTDNKKITVIYCAVNLDKFKLISLEKEKFILSVASLQPYKNLERLVLAFLKIKEIHKDLKLILVGGVNNQVFAKSNIFDLTKNRDDILFTGYIDDDKLLELYNKATLFVFPSLFEGFGMPPLEAMACGCPVVASSVASIPEVCGDAAYYVDSYSVDNIAEGIYNILTNENLKQSLIQKGFERVKMFSWEKSAKEVLRVIEEVVKTDENSCYS